LASRDATPSVNEGAPVCPESRDGTGCTPIITNGIIRVSEGSNVEGENSDDGGIGVDDRDSIAIVVSEAVSLNGDSTAVVDVGVACVSELNRYISK
jgi:hypothetical protein